MGGLLKGALIAISLLAFVFVSFIAAIEHPSTRGPIRCWIQESFYEQEWSDPPQGMPVIEAVLTTQPVRDMCDAADDPAMLGFAYISWADVEATLGL